MTMKSVGEQARYGQRAAEMVGARIISASMALAELATSCALFEDPARCDQSVATVRQAIGFADFASARKWREYTWKVCGESQQATLDALDKEIVAAEEAARAEEVAAKKKSAALAQERINAAQKLWLTFDGETPPNRNEALDATRKSATRLESGLTPTFALQLRKYNEGEYQKRLAALKR